MKKLVFLVCLAYVLLMILIGGCAPAQTPLPPSPIPPTITSSPIPPTLTPVATPTQKATESSISISVSPFYYSQDIQINVGNYSQQLRTSDLQELTALAQEMTRQKEVLTPEQMFVLAIRLYDLGNKDNSVYWFYEARFRAILFTKSLDPAHVGGLGQLSFELPAAYDAFAQLAGGYINGYAGCDIDHWINIVKMVKDDNPKPPELDQIFPDVFFIERGQWQQINDQVAAGLGELIINLSENKEMIRQQRATNNLDAQFCN